MPDCRPSWQRCRRAGAGHGRRQRTPNVSAPAKRSSIRPLMWPSRSAPGRRRIRHFPDRMRIIPISNCSSSRRRRAPRSCPAHAGRRGIGGLQSSPAGMTNRQRSRARRPGSSESCGWRCPGATDRDPRPAACRPARRHRPDRTVPGDGRRPPFNFSRSRR